jgi:hypothetical protein
MDSSKGIRNIKTSNPKNGISDFRTYSRYGLHGIRDVEVRTARSSASALARQSLAEPQPSRFCYRKACHTATTSCLPGQIGCKTMQVDVEE